MIRNEFMTAACTVAREAGAIIRKGFGAACQIEFKGPVDLVTEYDRKSEEHILARLQTLFPQHSFLAEESGLAVTRTDSPFKWLVDPLDGTTNFMHGVPQYAVSMGIAFAGVPVGGVVVDPTRGEVFTGLNIFDDI